MGERKLEISFVYYRMLGGDHHAIITPFRWKCVIIKLAKQSNGSRLFFID